MKRLYLVRHAKSSWKKPGLADRDRPLNDRGKRDAPMMGQRLAKRGARVDALVSSPARRAKKTAKAIAKEIGFPKSDIEVEERIYSGGPDDLWEIAKSQDDARNALMLVGHNPAFTEFADALTPDRIGHMPTCAVLCVEFDVERWTELAPGAGRVVFFDYPKKTG